MVSSTNDAIFSVNASAYLGRLLAYQVDDPDVVKSEMVVLWIVDAVHGLPNHIFVVNLSRGLYLTAQHDDIVLHHDLYPCACVWVFLYASIQQCVADLVCHLVGMAVAYILTNYCSLHILLLLMFC